MKKAWIICGLVAAGLVLFLCIQRWCAQNDSDPLLAPRLVFPAPGVLRIHDAQEAKLVRVFDPKARLVAIGEPFGRELFEIRFLWKPKTTYRIETDHGYSAKINSPMELPQIAIRLHAPLGQEIYEHVITDSRISEEPREVAIGARRGELLDFLLEIERVAYNEPVELMVSVGAGPVQASAIQFEPNIENNTKTLRFEFDKQLWSFRVKLTGEPHKANFVVKVKVFGADRIFRVRFFDTTFDQNDLELVSWLMPTDREGVHQLHNMPDQVVLPDPIWSRLGALFGFQIQVHDSFEPFSFQALELRNRTNRPIGLVLRAEVLDSQTGERVPFFDSPRFEVTGGAKDMIAFMRVEPFSSEVGVLPLYLQPEVPEGTFSRRVTITPMGYDRPLKVLKAPISVVRSKPFFTIWVLGISLLSIAWVVVTGLFFRKLLNKFRIRLLVLLSLLGSLQFVLQFTGGMASHVLQAVLGPFNCLVGGLLTEVLTYLLVACILYLVPRVGAMTLAGLVTYIMGGVLFGSFGLADLLFVGSQIAFRELFLLLFGVTGFKEPKGDKLPGLVQLVLALSLADAASAFTSLALHSVFYRLFFAGWYIFLQVVIAGFLYTSIGVLLGRRLGVSLRGVHS